MFGLCIIKQKATVTLTFDRLISKSPGIIYKPETNVCAKFDKPRSILCQVMQTRFGLTPQDHLHSDIHTCAKFHEPRSILCPVI